LGAFKPSESQISRMNQFKDLNLDEMKEGIIEAATEVLDTDGYIPLEKHD